LRSAFLDLGNCEDEEVVDEEVVDEEVYDEEVDDEEEQVASLA
jgi:hypothetical protein